MLLLPSPASAKARPPQLRGAGNGCDGGPHGPGKLLQPQWPMLSAAAAAAIQPALPQLLFLVPAHFLLHLTGSPVPPTPSRPARLEMHETSQAQCCAHSLSLRSPADGLNPTCCLIRDEMVADSGACLLRLCSQCKVTLATAPQRGHGVQRSRCPGRKGSLCPALA